MKYFFYIVLLTLSSQCRAENNCNNVSNKNINHVKETLAENFTMPYHLTVDPNTGTLFFSYSTGNVEEPFHSVYLNLKSKEQGIIAGINGGFCHAVDVKNGVVYLGGGDGIYQFDYKTKSAHFLNITENSIWQMFFKDGLYYTVYPKEGAYLYKNGVVKKLKQVENSNTLLIAVDNNHNIYVANSSGLFVNDKENKITHIGDYVINGFTADRNGNLYFSSPSQIYSIVDKTTVKKIENKIEGKTVVEISPDSLYGVAVDMDGNFIYATEDSVIRLKPDGNDCP
ncbi:ommochrome-binding protein-like [Aphomia sociella]